MTAAARVGAAARTAAGSAAASSAGTRARAAAESATARLAGTKAAVAGRAALSMLLDAFVAGLEPRVARFLDRSRRVAMVEADGIALYEIREGRAEPLGRLGAEGEAEPSLDVPRGSVLELRLPADRFLQRTLRLPDAGRAYLEPILAHRLERLTPWRAETVLYGFQVTEEAGLDGTIAVELIATSADFVAPHRARLEAAGLVPTALGSASEPLESPLRIDLYRGRPGGAGDDRLRRGVARGIAILFAVLVPAWIATALLAGSAEAELGEADARLSTLRAKLGNRAGAQGPRDRALIDAKRPETAMLTLIDRLSAALPDNTVLRELDVDAAKVRLVGRSADAPALIALLESQGDLRKVRFAAPVIRDAEKRDAFDIVAARAGAPEAAP